MCCVPIFSSNQCYCKHSSTPKPSNIPLNTEKAPQILPQLVLHCQKSLYQKQCFMPPSYQLSFDTMPSTLCQVLYMYLFKCSRKLFVISIIIFILRWGNWDSKRLKYLPKGIVGLWMVRFESKSNSKDSFLLFSSPYHERAGLAAQMALRERRCTNDLKNYFQFPHFQSLIYYSYGQF